LQIILLIGEIYRFYLILDLGNIFY